MKVLGVQHRRTRRPRGVNDQSAPKRDLRKPMQFDRCDHIARLETHDSAARQDLDLPLCHLRSHPELARHCHKVLL
jgi:hypothetical protein